ncbi:MAG: TPM domain-containing protein [Gemmataceae bacterium]|nr:TPM domain-containing protein [Gemmataceae bacterium]
MFHAAYKVGLAALLVGAFLVTSDAQAQDKHRQVQDDAGLFSKEAKDQANKVIADIFAKHNKELVIETVKTSPVAPEVNKEERDKWAMERFNKRGVDGVYVVFCKEPSFYRIRVGNETRKTYFTKQEISELETIINEHLKKDHDLTLTKMVGYVGDTITTNAPAKVAKQPKAVGNPVQQKAPGAPVHNPVRAKNVEEKGMPSWVGWVCLIVGVLVVVWVIFAIIRSMTGMMGGGGYAGGGGGGGMMGGGGGGFLTGMLGGMFGAMAGMWMYNNFFGGHANYSTGDWGGGHNQGDKQGDFGDKEGGEKGDYKGDTDNDAGGGGDDDAGGGGGGGDWGDAGGGGAGDAGGGGGDAGGGGGSGCGGAGCGGGGGD